MNNEYQRRVEALERDKCPNCGGLGECEDDTTYLGATPSGHWKCRICRGSGIAPPEPTDDDHKILARIQLAVALRQLFRAFSERHNVHITNIYIESERWPDYGIEVSISPASQGKPL